MPPSVFLEAEALTLRNLAISSTNSARALRRERYGLIVAVPRLRLAALARRQRLRYRATCTYLAQHKIRPHLISERTALCLEDTWRMHSM